MFKLIKKTKSGRRIGLLKSKRGVVTTPLFMPIATKGAVKNLTPEELNELGAKIILGNTYHLWLRPGDKIIKKSGGLHKFMNWSRPILTDSGGFQVFSLAKHRKITDEGIEFRDPLGGNKYFLTPEKSIEIQLALGSDIIMVLDECPPYPARRSEIEKAVRRTTEWAKRCKEYFEKKTKNKIADQKPLLFCIVQGGIYKDLRERSVKELIEIGSSTQDKPASGWDGYAIGGVAVGEPREYLQQILNWVLPLLPEKKPRYLMGLGRPEEIVAAVETGIDIFDCVIPTREARHGRIYKLKVKSSNLKVTDKNFYETLQINNARFAKDFKPVDENCSCYTCRNFSRAYLNHLFRTSEPLAQRLATIHNLKFYLELMEKLSIN